MFNENILFSNIYNIENLFCAWRKVKHIYDTNTDFIYNVNELVEFEANLDKNLKQLSMQIKNNEYSLEKLVPLWLPKVSNEKEARQNFYVAVRDQVVWTATINVIGPFFDDKMPFWSFGNRLYMPIWKEDSEVENCLNGKREQVTKFGDYSVSALNLYRKWSSSWPLFRKAISISTKKMLSIQFDDFTDEEEEEINNQKLAPESFKIKYWETTFWKKNKENNIYYATIDLKKFYPNIRCKEIVNTIGKFLNLNSDGVLINFFRKIFDFRVSPLLDLQNEPLELCTGIDLVTNKILCIPTGLFVAGFLSNIAMLPVDLEVYRIIEERRNVAHFRFVDDHVFLAYSLEDLCKWIKEYNEVLKKTLKNMEINKDKIEPVELKNYFLENSVEPESVEKACKLNAYLPSPFTTLTLKKLSGINTNPFDLLDTDGKMDLLKDIEHILSTDFPDEEIKKDTRVSWAASLLIRLVPLIDININDIYEKRLCLEIAYKNKDIRIDDFEREFNHCQNKIHENMTKIYQHVFGLLIKAIDDNIEKPKLWKKAVAYCRATGYNGTKILLDLLEKDSKLNDAGKKYLFGTVLFSLCINIAICINVHISNYYTSKEKYSSKKFVLDVDNLMPFFENISEKYNTEYTQKIFEYLKWTIGFYKFETDKNDDFKLTRNQEGLLWLLYPYAFGNTYISHTPKFIFKFAETLKNKEIDMLAKKLLLMYPSELGDAIRKELSDNRLSPASIPDIQIQGKKYRSLQTLFINNENRHCSMLSFEWTILRVFKSILDYLNMDTSVSFNFNESFEQNDFLNCAPCNFYIDKDIIKYENWGDLDKYFDTMIIHRKEVCDDYRFDSLFYNHSSIAKEKRQVYSCAVLLVCLLTGTLNFDPMIGRSSKIERNYRQLINKLNHIHVSSYTQAIIIGALSDKRFELHNNTVLDLYDKTNREDSLDEVIEIETLSDFAREINGALNTLKHYQLTLQDQDPKQLVPISLKNLSKAYNPYDQGSEENA